MKKRIHLLARAGALLLPALPAAGGVVLPDASALEETILQSLHGSAHDSALLGDLCDNYRSIASLAARVRDAGASREQYLAKTEKSLAKASPADRGHLRAVYGDISGFVWGPALPSPPMAGGAANGACFAAGARAG